MVQVENTGGQRAPIGPVSVRADSLISQPASDSPTAFALTCSSVLDEGDPGREHSVPEPDAEDSLDSTDSEDDDGDPTTVVTYTIIDKPEPMPGTTIIERDHDQDPPEMGEMEA